MEIEKEIFNQLLDSQSKINVKIDELNKTHATQYTELIKSQTELKVSIEDLKGIRDDIKELKKEHAKDVHTINNDIKEIREDVSNLKNVEERTDKLEDNQRWVVITIIGVVIVAILKIIGLG